MFFFAAGRCPLIRTVPRGQGLKYSVSQFDGTNLARTEPNAMPGFGLSMLDIGIALGLALVGFALGYGTREVVSYRRRQAARERYRQLGLVD
jgi:hypothetical protein